MNLSSTLETTWQNICGDQKRGLLGNQSLLAFQFCEALRAEHPGLNITFDGRDIPGQVHRPNVVIWSNEPDAKILFFCRLLRVTEAGFNLSAEMRELIHILDKKHMKVLTRDNLSGSYATKYLPLSPQFKFGLFILNDPDTDHDFQSIVAYLTQHQLEKFYFGKSCYGGPYWAGTDCEFRKPREAESVTRGKQYPDLSFKLANGREVWVDALVWEPTYSETKDIQSEGASRRLVIERKRMKTDEFFGSRKVHFVDLELANTDPPRMPNTAITVWLSSESLSPEAIYSELVVVFFFDFTKDTSLEEILSSGLKNLEWGKLAKDTDEETIALWKDAWLIRTIH